MARRSTPSLDNTRRALLGMKKGQVLDRYSPIVVRRLSSGTSDDRWQVMAAHASTSEALNLPLEEAVRTIVGVDRVLEKLPATEGQLTQDERKLLRRYLIGSRFGAETAGIVGVQGYSAGAEVWAEKSKIKGASMSKRKSNQSKTTLDFGRRLDDALDALDELGDTPNSDIQHGFGRVTFQAAPDDPRMVEIYSHLRRRGITWLGPGRDSNAGSLRERLKNAY